MQPVVDVVSPLRDPAGSFSAWIHVGQINALVLLRKVVDYLANLSINVLVMELACAMVGRQDGRDDDACLLQVLGIENAVQHSRHAASHFVDFIAGIGVIRACVDDDNVRLQTTKVRWVMIHHTSGESDLSYHWGTMHLEGL